MVVGAFKLCFFFSVNCCSLHSSVHWGELHQGTLNQRNRMTSKNKTCSLFCIQSFFFFCIDNGDICFGCLVFLTGYCKRLNMKQLLHKQFHSQYSYLLLDLKPSFKRPVAYQSLCFLTVKFNVGFSICIPVLVDYPSNQVVACCIQAYLFPFCSTVTTAMSYFTFPQTGSASFLFILTLC